MCSIGHKEHTQHTLGYLVQLCNVRFHLLDNRLVISTDVCKIASLKNVPTCTVLNSVRYRPTMSYRTRTHVQYGISSVRGSKTSRLRLSNFFWHRHKETFCVYYRYFSEELKESK